MQAMFVKRIFPKIYLINGNHGNKSCWLKQ